MSRPDMDAIITSPEAKTFLTMVTDGFYNNSYTGLWLFEAIGREWDEMKAWAEGLREEIHPQTCTWSIPIWEWVYGLPSDSSKSLQLRRQLVLAKMIAVKPVNPETLRRGVSALAGTDQVEMHDLTSPYSAEIQIYLSDATLPYYRLPSYLRETKPSHVHISTYPTLLVIVETYVRHEETVYDKLICGTFKCGEKPCPGTLGKILYIETDVNIAAHTAVFDTTLSGTIRVGGKLYDSTLGKILTDDVVVVFNSDYQVVDVLVSGESVSGVYPRTAVNGLFVGGSTEIDKTFVNTTSNILLTGLITAGGGETEKPKSAFIGSEIHVGKDAHTELPEELYSGTITAGGGRMEEPISSACIRYVQVENSTDPKLAEFSNSGTFRAGGEMTDPPMTVISQMIQAESGLQYGAGQSENAGTFRSGYGDAVSFSFGDDVGVDGEVRITASSIRRCGTAVCGNKK